MYIDLFLSFSVQSHYIEYRSVSYIFCLDPIKQKPIYLYLQDTLHACTQICFLPFLFRAIIQYIDLFLSFSVQSHSIQICFLAFLFRAIIQYIDQFLSFSVQSQYIVYRSVSQLFCLEPQYIDLVLSFSVKSQYIVYRSVSQLFCSEPIYSIQICFLAFLFRANIL